MRFDSQLKVCALMLALNALCSGPTWAQDAALSASPSADPGLAPGAESRPLWEVGIGGVAGVLADYPGSDRYRVTGLPLPYFIYRGNFFRSDSAGPRLHTRSGSVEFEFSGGGGLSSNSSSGPREGMPKLDYLLEAGPSAKITLDKPTPRSRLLLNLPLRAAISTNFGSRLDWRGLIFAPDLAFEDESIFGSRWGASVAIGAEFATARLQEFFYQVDPQYARADRPAYNAHGGYLSSNLKLSIHRRLTHNFNVFAATQFDLYAGAENQDSPLLKDKTSIGGAIGFAWSIWESKARAAYAE